jgi:hypothetical protein
MLLYKVLILTLLVCLSRSDKCFNEFSKDKITISGEFAQELGSSSNWLANEPLGDMKFDQRTCFYILKLKGLTSNKSYLYKV